MKKHFSTLLAIFNLVSIGIVCYLKYQLLFNFGIDAHDFAWPASEWFNKTDTITWTMFVIVILALLVNTIYLLAVRNKK